jgi:hypothetical protein
VETGESALARRRRQEEVRESRRPVQAQDPFGRARDVPVIRGQDHQEITPVVVPVEPAAEHEVAHRQLCSGRDHTFDRASPPRPAAGMGLRG